MPAQTSYSRLQPNAYPGMLADINVAKIISRSIEDVNGAAFGIAVSRGTDGEKQALVGIQSGGFLGITLRSLDREGRVADGNETLYRQKQTAAIIEDGYVFATCPTGCNPGNDVFADDTTGVLDAGTAGAGETQLDGASWESVTAAGEVGLIRLVSRETTAGA